jgi:tetratricopeptide (TPR) repeat protein
MTNADRARLCEQMVKNEIAFFAIPLGPNLDPQNLHGIASGTGGRVVRVMPSDDLVKATLGRLEVSLAAPILYPQSFQFKEQVAEFFPTQLPPLRADAPTLILGRLLHAAKSLSCTVSGTVAGQPVNVSLSETVTEPEVDNFFLVGIHDQWKNAKDQPAMMQADRTLAFAYDLNKRSCEELLAQAELVLQPKTNTEAKADRVAPHKLDAAAKLYEQVAKLDPNNTEAKGGLMLVDMLRSGRVSKDQLREQIAKDTTRVRIGKEDKEANGQNQVRKDRLVRLIQEAEAKAAQDKEKEIAPPTDPNSLLKQEKLRVAVEEQKIRELVDDALRQARRTLLSDPENARDLLRRTLDNVRDNPDLTDTVRQSLVSRLSQSLRSAEIEGRRIQEDVDARRKVVAQAEARYKIEENQLANDELARARMQMFRNLMNQARYEDAYQQAVAMTQDAINRGLPTPVAVTAASYEGLAKYNLSEVQELKRIRQERYLATLLQVEKSHVPFPDEPPVRFPPAATWKRLTEIRKERYETSGFTEDDPATLRKLREIRDKLNSPITIEFEPNTPLREALSHIAERYGLTILIDTEAFKADNNQPDIEAQPIKLPRLVGVSLTTALRAVLAQVNGTYVVRRDYIEITTPIRQVAEKTIRVYPVADLVIPIPNSVNQQAVNQSIQNSILGLQFSALAANPLLGLGGLGGGALGLGGVGLGLGLGGLGLGGLGAGGLGALGGLGGGLGAGGGGFGGGNLGGFGGIQGGMQNLGVGGGVAGFAGFGGQLGQFGNLGGQFGLQGGDQSMILVTLVRQVIGTPDDWAPLGAFQRPIGPPGQQPDDEEQDVTTRRTSNSVGYYPPARALVVKGTSRVQERLTGGILSPRPQAGGGGMGALDRKRDDAFAKGNNKELKDQAVAVAKEKSQKDQKGKADQVASSATNLNPRKIWQEKLDQRPVNDPGVIIAVADFLFEQKKFDHAAEFLKAVLRQGQVAKPWVYEALVVALKQSGEGTSEEIERAQLSLLDLQPQSARGYLQASRAMAEDKRFDQALVFCRQAAQLEPNLPEVYSQALTYADKLHDSQAMEWAAGNLLRRDWPNNNGELQVNAQEQLKSFSEALKAGKRLAEAERITGSVDLYKIRDLVIELSWQGEAGLAMQVKEPIGTIASFEQRQTPGGGTLIGDSLTDPTSAYVAAEGFPGEYEVTIRRLWGQPLGAKAKLKIIQHKGTPEQTERIETVVLDRDAKVRVVLDQGRRTSLASVSPAPQTPKSEAVAGRKAGSDKVFNKLRALADPELMISDSPVRGGLASMGLNVDSRTGASPGASAAGPVAGQQGIAALGNNGIDLTAQATVEGNRDGTRYVRLSVAPVFQTVPRMAGFTAQPVIVPGIPGGQ